MFTEYDGKIINLINVSSVTKTETLNDDGTVKTYDNTLTMQNGSKIVKSFQSENDRDSDYNAIESSMSGGGSAHLQTKSVSITENTSTNVNADDGYDGLKKVIVTTNVQPDLEDKSITISTNTTTLIEPTQGKDGMSSVSVTTNIPQPSGKITITENGTDIDVSSYASADVNVPAGADLSEYFESTIGSDTTGTLDKAPWISAIKKFPPFTASGTSLQYAFFKFKGNELPVITNLSTITNFIGTFYNCVGITEVDLSNETFSNNVNDCRSMFSGCTALEEVNLSSLVGTNTKKLDSMFQGCTSLKKINLSSLIGMTMSNMFQDCTALEELDISSMTMPTFSFSNMFKNVPTNCLILVKDQAAKDWFTTNFSNLTNVQIKSEYIANQGA